MQMGLAHYRTLDAGIGRWLQVDPEAESFYPYSAFNSMLNDPVSNIDPKGDFVHILVGAAIGGVGNLLYQGFSGNLGSFGDGLAAFGIGAGAGALGAATGGASLAAMGTAGSVGTAIGYGAASAAIGGASAGLVQGTGNALYFQNASIGDALRTGVENAAWGALSGAVIGGVVGGIVYKPSAVAGGPPNKPKVPVEESIDDFIGASSKFSASGGGNTVKVGGYVKENGSAFNVALDAPVSVTASRVSNAGNYTPYFGVYQRYNYISKAGGKVHVHPHAYKHLNNLSGRPLSNEYYKLTGKLYQESLHSAIEDVLSRGSLKYNHPYFSGGNRIIFGASGKTGPFPVVKHFSSYH